ncbi:MAG: cystathionine beta-lyase [Pseudomonadota bacterium]
MTNKVKKPKDYLPETFLVHGGRAKDLTGQFVSPPVVRASTVLFDNVDQMMGREAARFSYGLTNTPTIEALTTAINDLEDASGTVLVPSGLAAVTVALLSALKAGDQVLVPDNVYGPSRRFSNETLVDFGIDVTYYDPLAGAGIRSYFKDNIAGILVEPPGSHTFEMPDIKAILAAAKEVDAITLVDNTWASPLFYKPIPNGFDYSIQAGTKYLAGHSDALIGSISANEAHWPKLHRTHRNLGVQAGTEEIYLTLRGMRTMAVRMERQEKSALEIAKWLQKQPEVARVLHPALPEDPGHAIWKDTMGRSSGLFGLILNGVSHDGAAAMLNHLELFGLGYSWGGFESLAVLSQVDHIRSATKWQPEGPLIRLSIGLEHSDDLMADLRAGLDQIERYQDQVA